MKLQHLALCGVLACAGLTQAADEKAAYDFGHTLSSSIAGAPDLVAVDGINQNQYEDTTVFGAAHTVYASYGTAGTQNSGVTLDTTGLVDPHSYSLEMVVSLNDVDGWRKLADVSDLVSDAGYYYDPGHLQSVFPVVSGTTVLSANTYYYLALVVNADSVTGYVNGHLEFSAPTTVMNIDTADMVMSFMLDDSDTSGGEYTDSKLGAIHLWDGALTGDEVAQHSRDFGAPAVPEPASLLTLGVGAVVLLRRRRK